MSTDWSTLFGDQAERLQGIREPADLQGLGRTNLDRLVALAQNHAQALWQAGASSAELRLLREEITLLNRWRETTPEDKPLLPRLRMECFRVGDVVRIYLGDTPGALQTWANATITEKTKSHRSDWKNAPSQGYYWRHVAVGEQPLFSDSNRVAFATSEPRVLALQDWHWLQKALHEQEPFVYTFAANAYRDWQPLWCLERGVEVPGEAMNFCQWLH